MPYNNGTGLCFKFDDLKLFEALQQITKKANVSHILNLLDEYTNFMGEQSWECHFQVTLFVNFIRFDGLLPRFGQELGGFTIFMIVPQFMQLTDDQKKIRDTILAGKISEDKDEILKILSDTNYHFPTNCHETVRMLEGCQWILEQFSDDKENILSIGAKDFLKQLKLHGCTLERTQNRTPTSMSS